MGFYGKSACIVMVNSKTEKGVFYASEQWQHLKQVSLDIEKEF